ncbi:unnamed protein product [Blepharisma stoltei]|uniref:ATP synthase F0 subunit 8 n=1 Tax=Blepharisma stoltei TaxID=1481888 RepID=A0AAU9JB55_9CILI|nr:unnamed protein product [Blepharisma stoltei]
MLYLYFALLSIVLSKSIPPPVSMKDMELLKPEENICTQILYIFYRYIWVWLGIAIGIFAMSILFVIIKCLKKTPSEEKAATHSIFLQGRRILMPRINCFQGLRFQKTTLEEPQEEASEQVPLNSEQNKKSINFASGIFTETVIRRASTDQEHL